MRARIRGVVALAGALIVAAGIAFVALARIPRDPITLRVTRTSGGGAVESVHATYQYMHEGGLASAHGAPLEWETNFPAHVDGDALVTEAPLEEWTPQHDFRLWELRVGALVIHFSRYAARAADAHGVQTLSVVEGDLPAEIGFSTVGLREARLVVDDRPLTRVTLSVPDMPTVVRRDDDDDDEPAPSDLDDGVLPPRIENVRRDPGDIPLVSVCAGEHVAFTFDVRPWPTIQETIQAVLVDRVVLDELMRTRHEAGWEPEHELPLTITRAEWSSLVAADATRRGYYGGTPNLTLERGNHTVTFWSPPGDSLGAVELGSLAIVVCSFEESASSANAGVVGIEVGNRSCMTE